MNEIRNSFISCICLFFFDVGNKKREKRNRSDDNRIRNAGNSQCVYIYIIIICLLLFSESEYKYVARPERSG